MPLSTSSSSLRAPDAPWVKVWGAAIFFFLVIVVSIEMFWRSQGWLPNVVDNKVLWSNKRAQVYDTLPSRPVVLLGASRMQFGFSHEVFAEKVPQTPLVNLSLAGSCPLAVLKDLAADEQFVGVVLVSLTSDCFIQYTHGEQQGYVDYYHHRNPNQQANAWARAEVQSRLVLIDPAIKAIRLIKDALWSEPLPSPDYYVMDAERQIKADYALVDADNHRNNRVNKAKYRIREVPAVPVDTWLQQASVSHDWVRQIQARGGRVVFVRAPSSGEHWLLDQVSYPKELYWDRLMKLTPAQSVHFYDVPGMRDFELPDSSHLDLRDRDAFTHLLLNELQRMKIL